MSLRTVTAPLGLVGFLAFGSSLWAEEISVYFKTSPRLESLHPFSDPATLTLLVTAADGRPVEGGQVGIRLEAPKPGRWFSTDFPLVEGSRLIDMTLPLRRGRAEWNYLFPIRGEYQLAVGYIAPDGRQAARTFSLKIRENKQKWFFLVCFSLGLFVVGMVAGRIFMPSGAKQAKVVAAFLLLSMGVSANDSVAGQPAQPARLFGWLEIDPPIVGKPSRVHWRLLGGADGEPGAALLTLTITHLEKRKTVFSVERLPVAGEFAMHFQFTDGAEYRVSAVATAAGRPILRTEKNVSVTGVEPPVRAMIPAMGFFVALIAMGLGVGRWSKRRGV